MPFTKHEVATNFVWKLAERCGSQAISFVISIILARLLDPKDYGIIALSMVFIILLQVFADSGLATALIQKKSPDRLDYSTVFYANIILSILLYGAMFVMAPFIASFYGMPDLVLLIRLLSLVLIGNGMANVQQAYVSKHMIFKRFFYSTLSATVLSAVVGISMAYHGYGIWSLVAQQLVNRFTSCVVLWLTVPFRPLLAFSWNRLKELFSFGSKLLASALLDTGMQQVWQLIIGKVYSPSDLAFFNQGQKFPQVIVSNINASIDSILLPTMASVQDNRERIHDMTRRAIKTSIFVMAPSMMILAFSADTVVRLVLTDKWLPCVPFLCIFCIDYMFWPVHTANLNAINALGRSDIFLKLEIIKKILGICILCITVKYGVLAMALGTLFTGIASQVINSWPNKELLHYSYLDQLRDFMPTVILATMAGAISFIVGFLPISLFPKMIMQGITGGFCYIILCFLFKIDSLWFLLKTGSRLLHK